MLGSFICLYAVLALYGSALLYNEISENGCDPSAGVIGNETCDSNGPGVFGAMLGVAFAGMVLLFNDLSWSLICPIWLTERGFSLDC
jgi:hypothetical protein